jgi:hypothetical protein
MEREPVMTCASRGFRPDAIFILGMLHRTGTNHLADLFGLHEGVEVLTPIFEDQLVRNSPLLVAYVDAVTRNWTPGWNVPAEEGPALLRGIGDGIVGWLRSHAPGRTVVTKMPRIDNVDTFFDLFPGCGLVVLVRDGRSVVESGVRSFGWSYEAGFRRWADAAETVLAFRARHDGDPRVRFLRYEDLIADEATVMADLFGAFGLDPAGVDATAVGALPVRGSSALADSGSVHWQPVSRSASFDPRERWRDWDAHLHRRFNAVAGSAQVRLGYSVEEQTGSSGLVATVGSWRDRGAEGALRLRGRAGRVRQAARHAWW